MRTDRVYFLTDIINSSRRPNAVFVGNVFLALVIDISKLGFRVELSELRFGGNSAK